MTIQAWLLKATKQLRAADIDTARLDAELILAHVFGKSRTWLIAHSDETLEEAAPLFSEEDVSETQPSATGVQPLKAASEVDSGAVSPRDTLNSANKLLQQRINRIPLAYLTGKKEFYGRNFVVAPSVLIPRPETEAIIDLLKTCKDIELVIDVGCGSGCIGITAALELPHLDVTLADVSDEALEIAMENRDSLDIDVSFVQSDLLSSPPLENSRYDVILANLPYVDTSWERSPETDHEPSLALFAEDGGLKLIKKLITQAPAHLRSRGYLILEADPEQHDEIQTFAREHGFRKIESRDYAILLQIA